MANSYPTRDPIGNYNFAIQIGSIIQGNFKELSGLSASRAVNEYREGHEPNLEPRKLPGLRSLANITLRRGLVDGREIWNWFEKKRTDKDFKQDVDVVVFDDAFEEIARWQLKDAWPVRWSAPGLDATSTALAMEELELAFSQIALAD
ncbi:MAG: phage tail protein [Myxococcales bacterium]|nr:phage tail protein [Myxococcales bacterium]